MIKRFVIFFVTILLVQAEDLCYRISYNCDSNTENCENSLLVQPIDKIPAGHELVTGPQCGTSYSVNQRIPPSGRWSNSGASTNAGSCYNVDGGGLFYAYHHPQGSSSNTGFEVKEKAQFLFLVDTDDKLYFLIGLDKPSNADGGKFAMKIEGLNAGAEISLYDDGTSNVIDSSGSNWDSRFTYG